MIKTFRGLLEDGGTETIRLSTNTGLTGYKILKFELFPQNPGEANAESVVKVFTIEPDSVESTVNFDDPTILGVASMGNSTAGNVYPPTLTVVFDNVVFNQDIYVTHKETSGSESVNYYLELEQIKLDLSEATVATLKDMRGS
jgi:hypothetical protein